ncbi:hypothetical protein GH714_028895 [Hevea brasiliensis]|uniref:Very-long-chain 3-oxoacyl-CoA reductase n=1 Tax=Hevea brasiliensis TaxID=3981 RepID=A0A6A6LK01_HEVBR|nr:hypothetical protein GH714_028895 [Hevea brasiliensis]
MELCFVDKLKEQPYWLLVLFTMGSLSVLKFFFAFLKWVYVNFLRPAKNLKKYGSWALVTGPTDGIGKGFAFQLARKGINLVLVGRNPDKLKDVSDSIQSKYGKVQIKTVVVDFSGDINEGVKKIQETIEGLDVGVLINNVGVSYPYARFFHEVDEELLKNLIKVNVEGTTKVTQAVLPGMLKRKKGAIVNMGSGAAVVIPSDPLYAVYAATKAYIDQFSRCLYVEYKKSGIDVQCQVPLYVATKMASIRRSSFFIPSTDGYARAEKIIHEHPLCFPQFGEIKIHAIKVKRRECYYHLSDSMLVKSAFHGVNKSWFISVDASSAKEHDDNQHCLNLDSNNMVACDGINSNGSAQGVKLLLDGHPEKLSNVMDKQHFDPKAVVTDRLGLDFAGGDVLNNLEIGVEHMDDNNDETKSAHINNRPDSHTQGKRDQCDNENKSQKTPIGGRESGFKTGIDDVQGSLLPESALETGSRTKKKRKSRKRCKHAVRDLTLEETNAALPESGKNESQQEIIASQSFLENAIGVVPQDTVTENENINDEPRMVSYSNANKGTDYVMPSASVPIEGTGMLEKHNERKNDKSRKTDIDVQCFKSVEDTSQSKPVAKKKPLPSGQTENIDGIWDGSSTDTPEVVHLQSVYPTNEKRKKKKKSSNTLNQEIAPVPSSGANVREENCGEPKDLGEEFDAELVHGKHVRGVISSELVVVSLKEKHRNPFQEANLRPSSQEFDIVNGEASNVEGRHSEIVDPSKSSKKRKKSEKAKDIVSGTPSISVKEWVKGCISGTSPAEPNKTANRDHSDDNNNKQEFNVPSKDRKEASEIDTISTSFLATDKEIDDVIQNVVESVQQIRKGQVDSENMNGKSRRKTRKKRSSDGEKDIRVENDPLSTQSSQVKPHRLESNSEGRCLKAVVNVNPSESGRANEDTDDKEVCCESNRINFNYYFVPSQHSPEIVGSAEVLVDRATETNRLDGKMKAKKSKKKHDANSHGPSSDLQSSQALNENHGVGAKPQADNSSTIVLQSLLSNSKSEKITCQPNKELLNASDSLVIALPSSNSDEFNNVREEARRSITVEPSGISAHAKSKRAASNSSLERSKKTNFLNTRVNGHQSHEDDNHMNGKKSSTINTGEIVNNSQHKKSLIGVSGSIFNDDSNEASSNEADNSDASTRTQSDNSSDYSDEESNADFNLSQNGSHSWKRKEGGGKAFSKPFSSSGMTLDTILRSSSRYKKAKLTASQSQLEDTESQPVDFTPENEANP